MNELEILAGLFRDDLAMSERMRRIGNYTLALSHLEKALSTLKRMEKIYAAQRNPPPTIET